MTSILKPDNSLTYLDDNEMNRITAAEICCDEAVTILEHKGFDADTSPMMLGLRMLSRLCHEMLLGEVGGPSMHRTRLVDVRSRLDAAFPNQENK